MVTMPIRKDDLSGFIENFELMFHVVLKVLDGPVLLKS